MQGRYDELIVLTQKALQLKPNHYAYINNLGNAKKAKGDINDAINCYEKAISINPEYADAYNNLGTILQDKAYLTKQLTATRKLLISEKILRKRTII